MHQTKQALILHFYGQETLHVSSSTKINSKNVFSSQNQWKKDKNYHNKLKSRSMKWHDKIWIVYLKSQQKNVLKLDLKALL